MVGYADGTELQIIKIQNSVSFSRDRGNPQLVVCLAVRMEASDDAPAKIFN